jgi:O-acetyl-ADP-ribose deacetylase (regulator of RNase III)
MDAHANQHDPLARKDHDPSLIARNNGDARAYDRKTQRDSATIGGIDVRIVEASVTSVVADAIVNCANEALTGGGGVDASVHAACGPGLLLEILDRFRPDGSGARLYTGCAVTTGAHALASSRVVIHVVGPYLAPDGSCQPHLLRKAYRSVMEQAMAARASSLAIPSISTGYYGYPMDLAGREALRTIKTFAEQHPGYRPSIMLLAYCGTNARILRGVLAEFAEDEGASPQKTV